MRTTTEITFDVTGQTLEYRVPQGRPTSATFDVFTDTANDDATAEFSGTATVDSVSTTVSSASGPSQTDPQRINLTSSTGVTLGRKYLLAESSIKEWVEPIVIGTGYIRVRHPLKSDYTTSATFVSTTITAAVDSTWVAAEENISDHKDPAPAYRIRWEILVSSVTYIAYSYFDLVRAPVVSEVDIDDLNARAPGLADTLPTEYQVENGRPLIDGAWRAVQAHLASVGIDTAAMRNDEVLDELVILRSLRALAEGGWRPMSMDLAAYLELTISNYGRFFEQHVLTLTKLASGQGSGVDKQPARVMWAK